MAGVVPFDFLAGFRWLANGLHSELTLLDRNLLSEIISACTNLLLPALILVHVARDFALLTIWTSLMLAAWSPVTMRFLSSGLTLHSHAALSQCAHPRP